MPQGTNHGQLRGNVCHTIFEILLNKRHIKHFDAILEKDNIEGSPAVYRLILKHCKRDKIDDVVNLDLINLMILVALKNDFYCNGSITVEPEWHFDIQSTGDYEYYINGFVDKRAIYSDGSVIVNDYKTSKKRLQEEELEGNLQAYTYSLAVWKKTGKIPSVRFLFLRFPKKLIQQAEPITEKQLIGYECYLDYLTRYLENFTEKDASSNFALNDPKNRWLCGRNYTPDSTAWGCEYRHPCDYYALEDENGQILASSFKKKDLKIKDKQKIVKRHYNGCPAFKMRKAETDDFL